MGTKKIRAQMPAQTTTVAFVPEGNETLNESAFTR
jgi:hypothetical protein